MKYVRKMAKFTCWTCKEEFEKPESEIKRNEEKGRRNFCSRKCLGKSNNAHLWKFHGRGTTKGTIRTDEFTGLRDFIRRSRRRKHDSSITKEDLLEVWKKQEGICPYTGIKLIKPGTKGVNYPITTASLDRIDSSIGYIKENVQFISMSINFMKNTLTHEETIKLCKTIANYWQNIDNESFTTQIVV